MSIGPADTPLSLLVVELSPPDTLGVGFRCRRRIFELRGCRISRSLWNDYSDCSGGYAVIIVRSPHI